MIPDNIVRKAVEEAAYEAGFRGAEVSSAYAEVMGKSRRAKVCEIRHDAWYLLHMQGYGSSDIGREFGRDHGTVISGIRNAEARATAKAGE